MTDNKINNYFSFYLKEDLLLFNASGYLNELSLKVADVLYDWGLYDDYVYCNHQLLNTLIIDLISKDSNKILYFAKKNNFKVLTYLSVNSNEFQWKEYFKDSLFFYKTCKKHFKKLFPNYFECTNNQLFKACRGKFLNIKCIVPSGEDQEFLAQILDKIKK